MFDRGHGFRSAKCPLMTQSGHPRQSHQPDTALQYLGRSATRSIFIELRSNYFVPVVPVPVVPLPVVSLPPPRRSSRRSWRPVRRSSRRSWRPVRRS